MKNLMYRMILVYIGCLLAALVAMCGCKTSAPELTQSDRSESLTRQEQLELFSVMQENWNASLHEASSSWSEQLWDLNAQWNRTTYSPPDSTGKQYIQSEESMKSEGSGKKQQKDTVFVDFKQDAIRQEFTALNRQMAELRSMISRLEIDKKARITWYQAALQFLGVCGIIYTIYRIFIRKSP